MKKNDNFQKVYKTFLKLHKSQLDTYVIQSTLTIEQYCRKQEEAGEYLPGSAEKMIAGIAEMFLKSDKVVTKVERDFVLSIFRNSHYEDVIRNVLDDNIEQGEEGWDTIIDKLPIEVKDAVCMLGLCLLVSDSEIDPLEQELFEKIYK